MSILHNNNSNVLARRTSHGIRKSKQILCFITIHQIVILKRFQVVEGQEIVHKIELVKTNTDDIPVKSVYITKSGVVPTPQPFYVSDEKYE